MTPGNVARPLSKDSSFKSPETTAPTTVTKKKAAPAPVSQLSQPPTPAAQKPPVSAPVPQSVSAKKSTVPESVSQVASSVQTPPRKPVS